MAWLARPPGSASARGSGSGRGRRRAARGGRSRGTVRGRRRAPRARGWGGGCPRWRRATRSVGRRGLPQGGRGRRGRGGSAWVVVQERYGRTGTVQVQRSGSCRGSAAGGGRG